MTSFRATSMLVLGAASLAALAVRFGPARQEQRPPVIPPLAVAIAPRAASGGPEISPPASDQSVDRDVIRAEAVAAEVEVEPVPWASDTASAESWSIADKWLGMYELSALDRADRTPRPFVPGCITLPPTAFVCPGDWALLTEEVDPDWSRATEERLKEIWRTKVSGAPSDFLFVMCKTTLCEINYRFPPGSDAAAINTPMYLFTQGVRASGLTSELQRSCVTYSGTIVAVEYERKFPQARQQSSQRGETLCNWVGLKKRGR